MSKSKQGETAPLGRTCVYFIADPLLNRIKIGTTSSLRTRLANLQKTAGRKLQLISWKRGGVATERAVHRLLTDHHLDGEWFADCVEVRALAEAADWPDEISSAAKSKTVSGVAEQLLDTAPMHFAVPPPVPPGPHSSGEPFIEVIRSAISFIILHEGTAVGGTAQAIGRAAEVLGMKPATVRHIWYDGKAVPSAHVFDQFEIRFREYLDVLAERAREFAVALDEAAPLWQRRVNYINPSICEMHTGAVRKAARRAAVGGNEDD